MKDFGDVVPEGRVSRALGSAWLARQSSALLCVPSVIIQEEVNVLVSPSHVDAKRLTTASPLSSSNFRRVATTRIRATVRWPAASGSASPALALRWYVVSGRPIMSSTLGAGSLKALEIKTTVNAGTPSSTARRTHRGAAYGEAKLLSA